MKAGKPTTPKIVLLIEQLRDELINEYGNNDYSFTIAVKGEILAASSSLTGTIIAVENK